MLTGILRFARCGSPCRGFTHKESTRLGKSEWPYYVCAARRGQGAAVCPQRHFRQSEVNAKTLELLKSMVLPGLAEAVDAAIKSYAGQQRGATRQARRKSIDERLLADLYEMEDMK